MGMIVNELRALLGRLIDEHGLVLWFDPERQYEASLDEAAPVNSEPPLRFEGSYYDLRYRAERFLRGSEPPKLLVYLDVEYDDARFPLSEMIALGHVIRPGEKGLSNTRLAVVAKRALKGHIPDARLEGLPREIEENRLTLAELEDLALGGGETHVPTALSVIYGAQHVEDAALAFLARPETDAQVTDKSAAGELAEMLRANYGLDRRSDETTAELRKRFARLVLGAELLLTLRQDAPEALAAVEIPREPAVAKRCAELAARWRDSLDLAGSYADASATAERSLHLESIDVPFGGLCRVETFVGAERKLLRECARRLARGPDDQTEALARKRAAMFWSTRDPELRALWDLLPRAAEIARLGDLIDAQLKSMPSAVEIARAYTQGDPPWSRLDTLHRQFEKKASSLDFLLSEQPEEVDALVVATRRRYHATADRLCEAFTRGLAKADFELRGFYRQTQVFERHVAPRLEDGPVAYLLVDALRYELAQELAELLKTDFEVEVETIAGTMPGVTEVGMAALLPHAGHGLRVGAGKKGGLDVACGDAPLRNRADRIKYLEAVADVPTVALKLESPRQFKAGVKKLEGERGLVLVTSREIDRAGEEDLTEARRLMEDVLSHVRLALRRLAEAGIERLVVATDHGFLFGEELAESEKIDSPGGRQALLHRRVWVGEGGRASESYLRTKVSQFGASSDLEMAVPWNLSGFRAGGSEAYFHGGLAPQEFLLPVLLLRSKTSAAGSAGQKVEWELKLGSAKVTAVHLTVTVAGRAGLLFETEWPRVRIEIHCDGEPCSMPVSATYGFSETTGEIALRGVAGNPGQTEPNSVTLMLTSKAPRSGVVSIHLLDAVSGVELGKLSSIEVSRVF